MEKCKHGVKDGGKEREEETEVDDGTLEEIGNRKEVDDVHRCKRVSTLPPRQNARFTSSPPWCGATLSSATRVRSMGNLSSSIRTVPRISLAEQLLAHVPKRHRDLLNEVHNPSGKDALLAHRNTWQPY